MAQFPGDMSADLASLRLLRTPGFGRSRRSVEDRDFDPPFVPLRARADLVASAARTEAVGHAVWESAARARRLGGTIPVADALNADHLGYRPGNRIMYAWLAGISLWAIALFLLSLE